MSTCCDELYVKHGLETLVYTNTQTPVREPTQHSDAGQNQNNLRTMMLANFQHGGETPLLSTVPSAKTTPSFSEHHNHVMISLGPIGQIPEQQHVEL